jgi:hypothetical protein
LSATAGPPVLLTPGAGDLGSRTLWARVGTPLPDAQSTLGHPGV